MVCAKYAKPPTFPQAFPISWVCGQPPAVTVDLTTESERFDRDPDTTWVAKILPLHGGLKRRIF